MIGEVSTSGSFAGALGYAMRVKPEDKNLSKEELEKKFPEVTPTADDPGWKAGQRHRVIAGNLSGETEKELASEFSAVQDLRRDIKNPVMSLSVRKAPADTVNLQTWEEISEQIIENLELQECPFAVIQHRDKDDHIHIIASRVTLDGKVVSDSKSYERVEQVMREVEIKYDLERVEGSQETYDRAPTWWEHKMAQEKGILSPRMEMQARISSVLEDKPTTTQFITRLREAHGMEIIFRLDENGAPCGVSLRYQDVTMSGSSLGRGYTWKKLQERGLTYDERDIEAVKGASQRAGQGRQPVADQERTVDGAARTVGDAGRSTVDDRPSGGAVREADREYCRREDQGQQHAARPSLPRGDNQPDQAGLSQAEADNVSIGGESSTGSYQQATDETLLDALAKPQTDPFFIDTSPDLSNYFNPGFSTNPSSVGYPGAIAEESQANGVAGYNRAIGPLDVCGVDPVLNSSVCEVGNQPLAASASNTSDFRDLIRDAISEVDAYMQDYWQESVQCQAFVTIDPIELCETSAEVEVEAVEIIEAVIEL